MKFIFSVLILFFSQVLYSQYFDTKVFTVNEGLFSNNIQKTYIDSEGTLWIGSRAGLSKKKMNSFVIVNEATQHKFNNIFDIYEDENKRMWIAGYGQGLLYFDKYSSQLLNTENGLVNNFVRKIFPFKNKLYIGTLNGISIISKSDLSIINPKFSQNSDYEFTVTSFFEVNDKIYVTTLNHGLYLIENNILVKILDFKKIYSSYVWDEKIYFGTENELLILNSKTFEIISKYPVSNICQFSPYKGNMCFISSGIYDSDGGIYKLEGTKLLNRVAALKLPFLDLKCFAYDDKNELLYIGTQNNGLLQVNLNAAIFHDDLLDKVYTLCNKNDKAYIFHDKGFSIISKNKIVKNIKLKEFKTFQAKYDNKFKHHTISSNYFYPIDYQLPEKNIQFYNSLIYQNKIWVSSNIGMFELTLDGEIEKYHPIHIMHFTFFQGKLTTVVPYAGLRVFDNIDTMDYKYYNNLDDPNIPADIVSMTNTGDALYFASALSGLYEYKNGKFKSYISSKEFLERKLKRVTSTSNGTIVVVSDFNDVYEFDIKQKPIKIIRQISYEKIKGSATAFVDEFAGVLYIGTNLGINVFKGDKYFFINRSQGLTNYNIGKAVRDNSKLNILTSKGVYVLDNSYFNRELPRLNSVKISKITVNNLSLNQQMIDELHKGLVLDYKQNNINIFFTLTNEKFPDKLKFKYRLKSSEPWIDLVHETQINLSYLDSGEYNIDIQITNEDTGDVRIQRLIKIEIEAPFYFKLPFILFLAVLFSLILILIIKLRMNYINNSQQKKIMLIRLKVEQEKKELLFDKQIAEVKLQALKSQMNSHFLFNVLSSIQYFIISKDIDNALYYLERFSSLIRRTLDFSDKKTISLNEEIDYLRQYVEIENIRVENQILFEVIVEPNLNLNTIEISPLLLQPFIENSIVHAFPNSIEKPLIKLYIEKLKNIIQITILDNGIGDQGLKNDTHDAKGISIVKKRLDLTQKNYDERIDVVFSKNGTKVIIRLDL